MPGGRRGRRRWHLSAHGMCHGCAIGRHPDAAEKLMTQALTCGNRPNRVERVTRVELAFSAWEADVLPLNYTRRTAEGAAYAMGTGGRIGGRRRSAADRAGCG